MKNYLIATLAGALAFLAIMLINHTETSKANPYQPICAISNPPAQCFIPGLGDYLRQKDRYCSAWTHPTDNNTRERMLTWATCMVSNERMSHSGRACLIAAGVSVAGTVVGGLIGGATARAIAGGIAGGAGTACVAKIVGS